jgi:hypothetical protein
MPSPEVPSMNSIEKIADSVQQYLWDLGKRESANLLTAKLQEDAERRLSVKKQAASYRDWTDISLSACSILTGIGTIALSVNTPWLVEKYQNRLASWKWLPSGFLCQFNDSPKGLNYQKIQEAGQKVLSTLQGILQQGQGIYHNIKTARRTENDADLETSKNALGEVNSLHQQLLTHRQRNQEAMKTLHEAFLKAAQGLCS